MFNISGIKEDNKIALNLLNLFVLNQLTNLNLFNVTGKKNVEIKKINIT